MGALSYRIDERPWRTYGQPTPFITFWQVLRNNSWRSNKHDEKKTENEWTQNMVKKMCRWKRMPMYLDEWIEFKWRNLVWLE